MRARALVIGLAAALLLPAAVSAQSGSGETADRETQMIDLYGHVFGLGMAGEGDIGPMPANTDPPTGESNLGLGLFHWCTAQGSAQLVVGTGAVEPGDGCKTDEDNVLALFSTPGIVQVENRAQFQQEGAYGLLHNERGQTKDVLLGDEAVEATIFLTVDRHGWPVGNGQGTNCYYEHYPNVPCVWPYWGWDVGAQPHFTVETTLYQADLGARDNASAAPPVGEAIQNGDAEVIAQGAQTMQVAANGLPNTPKALEFNVDLGSPQVDRIDRSKDFFVTYRFYSETNGQPWGLASWRVWSGEFFPPSFTMPVQNALTVERVIPTFAHGQLAIVSVVNTPWGSYDVKKGSVDLSITGPDGDAVDPDRIETSGLSRSLAHGGHYAPVNKTWVWDYQAEDLTPGEYTVSVDASNLQGSSTATCSASFTIEEGPQGRLVPGTTTPGACGLQSVGEEAAQDLAEGAGEQAGG